MAAETPRARHARGLEHRSRLPTPTAVPRLKIQSSSLYPAELGVTEVRNVGMVLLRCESKEMGLKNLEPTRANERSIGFLNGA